MRGGLLGAGHADEILDKMRRFGLRVQQVHGQ